MSAVGYRAFRHLLGEETGASGQLIIPQNLHFQTGGWMMDELAKRYDTHLEVLFMELENATRRHALLPLYEIFAGRDQRQRDSLTSAVAPDVFRFR